MFKVIYKYSACIKICTDDVNILCDPWFGKDAYEGTWTQFPQIQNIDDFIGNFDIVYLSHIHPDHYCPETLKILFNKFGEKEILIADWGDKHPNYLEKKLRNDGLEKFLNVNNHKIFNDTEINIVPNKTGSASDIDSALIVSSKSLKKSVLNINDCIYNKYLFNEIIKHKNNLNTEFSLFCLGYTGAGPYPQTYYSPEIEKDILIEKALEKKRKFFERYQNAINSIPSKRRLPFAGKYLLAGDLSVLNKYRGVADALEVKSIDSGAIVLDDGGDAYFDLEKNHVSRERKKLYDFPEKIESQRDYFWRKAISFYPTKTLLKRIIVQCIKRAHNKSQCESNYFYSIYPYDDKNTLSHIWSLKKPYKNIEPIITFNCCKDKNPFDLNVKSEIHAHLFIESKALFAVLTGISHWNNFEVGSVFQIRRIPDKFNRNMQSYLNFLSIV